MSSCVHLATCDDELTRKVEGLGYEARRDFVALDEIMAGDELVALGGSADLSARATDW